MTAKWPNQRAMRKIDKVISQRLRIYRVCAGITQEKLARELGIKFQQVQKYESGTNRITAGRLWDAAQALGVEVKELFPVQP